jgi:hypothetical protein
MSAPEGGRAKILSLIASTGPNKHDKRVIAQLTRSRSTRTAGSSKFAAGDGGRLVIDRNAGLDERLILATCIAMLKREATKRREKQFLTASGSMALYVILTLPSNDADLD